MSVSSSWFEVFTVNAQVKVDPLLNPPGARGSPFSNGSWLTWGWLAGWYQPCGAWLTSFLTRSSPVSCA